MPDFNDLLPVTAVPKTVIYNFIAAGGVTACISSRDETGIYAGRVIVTNARRAFCWEGCPRTLAFSAGAAVAVPAQQACLIIIWGIKGTYMCLCGRVVLAYIDFSIFAYARAIIAFIIGVVAGALHASKIWVAADVLCCATCLCGNAFVGIHSGNAKGAKALCLNGIVGFTCCAISNCNLITWDRPFAADA